MSTGNLRHARDISQILTLDKVYLIGTSFAQNRTIKWQRAVKALSYKHVLGTERA